MIDSAGNRWTATTLQNGEFIFMDLPPGNYTLEASASGHLSAAVEITLLPGMTITLPTIDLPQGDLNGDGGIDEADVAILSALYGKPFANADLDGNGVIGLADLRLLAAAMGLTGPVVWR